GRSRPRSSRARASSVPLSKSSFTASMPYPAPANSRIIASASSGVPASRTSTPARRNPVAVSGSVITATLNKRQLPPREIGGQAEQFGVRDHAQVADLRRLAGQIADDHVQRQRIA